MDSLDFITQRLKDKINLYIDLTKTMMLIIKNYLYQKTQETSCFALY
jgi:hypothetical protein